MNRTTTKNVLDLAKRLGVDVQSVSRPGDGATRYVLVVKGCADFGFGCTRSAYIFLLGVEAGRM